MKKLIILALLTANVYASDSAEVLFDTKCMMCHSKTRPADISTVIAPALMGVMRHIKMEYPDRDEAIAFMSDYILNPTIDKAICMPSKIERFGLMPSQKGSVTNKELKEITGWMFDNFPPAGFRGMRRGMGMGRRMGR